MNTDWLGLLSLLAAGLAVYVAALVAFIAWMLTHPPRRGYAWAVARGVPGDPSEVLLTHDRGARGPRPAFEVRTLSIAGRATAVWDIPGDDPDGPIVIVTHGWGDSRVVMLSRLPWLMPVCSRVVMWDLPAHGDSAKGGVCALGASEPAALVELMCEIARERHAPGASDVLAANPGILLVGFSLGAGVSLAAAAELSRPEGACKPRAELAGVIAEAPYRVPLTPARNVLRLRGLPNRCVPNVALALLGTAIEQRIAGARWGKGQWPAEPAAVRGTADPGDRAAAKFEDRAALVARLPAGCPLLVIHGDRDEVCPLEDGRAIAKSARDGRLAIIEGAGHLDLWTNAATAARAGAQIAEFVAATAQRSVAGDSICG